MCGIFGVINKNLEKNGINQVLDKLERALRHRGPDGSGRYAEHGVGLGMTRLAIVDIAGGFQPFCSDDGRYQFICNGEIYNYLRLQKHLAHRGIKLRSQSDVEVLLHLILLHGLDALKLVEGIFAFALWDNQEETLLLGRDRFGIKPLFYTNTNNSFGFASELKALKHAPNFKGEIDLIALSQYLSFEYVPAPRTILKNVFRLKPGSCLEVKNGTAKEIDYWEPSFAQSESRPPIDAREYAQELQRRLQGAIKRESTADTPVGIFLSGGIDSGSLLALRRQTDASEIKTFSVRFDELSFNESEYSLLLAQKFNSNHKELTITKNDCIELASSIGRILDEPIADSSFIPTYLLSKFAAADVKVVLGGDGSDELLAGYPTYKAHRLIEWYERLLPFFIRARVIPKLVNNLPTSLAYMSFDFKAKRFLDGRGLPFLIRHHQWMGAFGKRSVNSVWHPSLVMDQIDPYEPVNELALRTDAQLSYNKALHCDLRLFLEGDILTKVDRASMAHGLEVRVPFLNREVADFILDLPFDLKLKNLTSKYIFKRSLIGVLPDQILNRKKMGFNIPMAQLLRNELRSFMESVLNKTAIEQEGIFNSAVIEEMKSKHLSGAVDYRKELWNLIVFRSWFEEFLK